MIYIMHPQRDQILGYITPNNYWNDEHHHGLDGVHFIQFETFANSEEARFLTDRCRLIMQASSGIWQEFIAHEITTRTGKKLKIVATGAEMELDGLKIIYPETHTDTLESYLSVGISDTDWQMGIVDHASFQTQTFDQHLGGYTYLKRIANYFDRELRFRVEVSGHRFRGRFVDMLERVGADKRKEIVAGENLIGIERTFFSNDVITGLICKGPEGDDGQRLEIRVTNEDAFQRWNRNDKNIWGIYEPSTENADMTEDRLRTLGEMELKKRIDAVVEYKIDAAVLPEDDVQLGDTLRIKDEDFVPPLYAESRAVFIKERIGREDLEKSYTIGEIVELEEEDVMRNARKAQALYGAKIFTSQYPPEGQSNAIWIKPKDPLKPLKPAVPHSFNMDAQQWQKIAPTEAGEIGGLEVGTQYNGVSITPEEGLVVDRTDELARTVVNATEGISIEARASVAEAFSKMLYIDVNGNLKFKGDLEGAGGSFSGALSSGDGSSQIRIDNGRVYGGDHILFSVDSVLPELFHQYGMGNVHGKIYTHYLEIPVAAGDYGVGDFIEVNMPVADFTEVAIGGILGVFMQSETKEWYSYERRGSRVFTEGELSSLTVRISPNYSYTSTGVVVPISVMVVGYR